MPILFTIMNGIEEELIESREVYNEMAAVMWKDLRGEADTLRRMPRQACEFYCPVQHVLAL